MLSQVVTDGLVAVLAITPPLVTGIMMATATLADDPPVPAVHWVLPLTVPGHCVKVIPLPMLLRQTANWKNEKLYLMSLNNHAPRLPVIRQFGVKRVSC